MKSALTGELKSVATTAVLVSKRENLAKVNQVDRFRSVRSLWSVKSTDLI